MPLNKTNIPVATTRHSKLDLSCEHITTMQFMELQPVFYRHMIKGEHLNFNALATCRPAPIELPIFGRMRLNMRGFFVPYRLVFPNWAEFYNDTIASNYSNSSLVSGVPYITSYDIHDMFMTANFSLTRLVELDPVTSEPLEEADFTINGNNPGDPAIGYRYTQAGRHLLKILESLGYKHIPSFNNKDVITWNALSILAYAKIYIDWFANSQYLNSSDVLSVERFLKYNDPTGSAHVGASQLYTILALIGTTVYDTEHYYVNAWDNPVAPNSGQFTSFSFNDPTSLSFGGQVLTDGNGTPYMNSVEAAEGYLGTTFLHEALKRLSDFQKRHALAGARSIDRVLAQYGIVTDSLKQTRSIYVGSQSIDINSGTIFGTSNSSNSDGSSSVGDFAGTSFGQGSKAWDYQNDDEGVFIVLASLQPDAHLCQGYDRNNCHISRSQFFVPEFDALGVQCIQKGEVYVDNNESFASSPDRYELSFGFSGRYGEYKRPKSFVTGDISLPAHYAGGRSWHLMRLFNGQSFSNSVNNVSHSLNFSRGRDAAQYNRIFQYTENDYDKFYVDFHFDVGCYSPCRPLFETYEFDDNGKSVTLDTNGAKLN